MNISENIFKSYDIRGLYPQEINEENIVPIIQAIYSVLQTQKKTTSPLTVALGRDMRISSPSLFKRALSTLVDLGASVIDIGLLSTPTFYFAIYSYKYDAGIQITASHNPKDYNGIKIVRNSGNGLVKIGKGTGMEDIKMQALQEVCIVNKTSGTCTKKDNIQEDEVQNALRMVDNPPLRKFKIVADTANAMGATYIDALFKHLDSQLIRMNFELDGTFPSHQPDPLQYDTLVDLQKKVVAEHADLGLAPDGDGDRLFFIDEKGQIVPPSFITALVAWDLLKKHPRSKILFDIRYILTPQEVVRNSGGIPVVTKVGHAFITQQLAEEDGLFAGESSGHYFFKETGNAESQVPIILTVLKVLTEENKKLSEVIKEIRRSYESGEINFKVKNTQEIAEKLRDRYSNGDVSMLDGIAVSYDDWKFSLRSSNTEPLLRLNVEAKTYDTMKEKTEEITKLITSVGHET